ncbi:MAG: hypothetical protein E5X55_26050 [Mesorhizobium sp.]|nr:MAG: hypothetical protein EOR57_22115 [Mesorhizobium sp.]TIP70771.1 MAG: hypothetical protein E5X55_26050 [Mesorhizobium sp.]TIQ16750.1 MAG: hypothetical protein E5X51_33735 [Mesorhizobium sp.]TJV95474.1 MAG: hypothetical protein E5X52_24095 [Mesorhizobium sp.]
MAETMLLLVFCLLLVAAAIIADQRRKTEQALDSLRAANTELAEQKRKAEENRELIAKLASVFTSQADREQFEKEWRELILAKEFVETVTSTGLSIKDISRLMPAIEILRDNGFTDVEDGEAAVRVAELIRQATKAEETKPHDWPPIINLSEAGGYFFEIGSAELSKEFETRLSVDTAGRIARILEQYEVDIIEVIGHTDEQPLSGQSSNIDGSLRAVLQGKARIETLRPADNAGLGLARAIAVAEILGRDARLKDATILPLSAAQLIMPGDRLTDGAQTGDVKERRRIEIRVRRRTEEHSMRAAGQP